MSKFHFLIKKSQLRLIPGYIIVIAWVSFTILLIGWVVFASFSTTSEIYSNHMYAFKSGFHFENYVTAWTSGHVSVYFMNSFIYSIVSCIAIILIASPASYVLSRFRFKGNKIFQNLFVSALGIPIIMIIMPMFGIVSQFHLINNRWLVIFLYVAKNVPFTIFFMLPFFKSLSTTYEEAACIDGCSPIRTFWQIMFPLVQPGLVTVTIFVFINIWNEYFMSLIFANKVEVRPVAVGLFNMVAAMRYTGNYGGLFASVVIIFVPTFVLYLFFSQKIIKSIAAGAIKG